MGIKLYIRTSTGKIGQKSAHFYDRWVKGCSECVPVHGQSPESAGELAISSARRIRSISDFNLIKLLGQRVMHLRRDRQAFGGRVGVDYFALKARVRNDAEFRYELVENWEGIFRKTEGITNRISNFNVVEDWKHLSFQVRKAGFYLGLKTLEHARYLCLISLVIAQTLLGSLVPAHPHSNKDGRDRAYRLHPRWPVEIVWGYEGTRDKQSECIGSAEQVEGCEALGMAELGCHKGILA